VFGNTDRATVPLALALAPDVTATQPSPVEAVQPHPVSVVTSNVRRPPANPIASPARLNAY